MFNPTIAAITLRGLLGRRRSLLIALAPLILLALTIGLRAGGATDHAWPGVVLGQIGLVVVVPLTAMIIGTSVLGTEVDDSSILHLLATPVSRTTVIVTKWIVAVRGDAGVRRGAARGGGLHRHRGPSTTRTAGAAGLRRHAGGHEMAVASSSGPSSARSPTARSSCSCRR